MTIADAPVLILMYHRICPYTPDTACYFARGTAVTPETFLTQVAWFAQRREIVTLNEALRRVQANEQNHPLCVLTFDDGYQDCLPYASHYPLTLFPIANHLAEDHALMFVDHYYALLHHARHRKQIDLSHLLPTLSVCPGLDDNLNWWVSGPVKQHLQTLPVQNKKHFLQQLQETLAVPVLPNNQAFYLSQHALNTLAKAGHQIGGHGQTHQRLTILNPIELQEELNTAHQLVETYHPNSPAAFCYPDGAYNQQVIQAVQHAGFHCACSVESDFWLGDNATIFHLPRLFMRNEWRMPINH